MSGLRVLELSQALLDIGEVPRAQGDPEEGQSVEGVVPAHAVLQSDARFNKQVLHRPVELALDRAVEVGEDVATVGCLLGEMLVVGRSPRHALGCATADDSQPIPVAVHEEQCGECRRQLRGPRQVGCNIRDGDSCREQRMRVNTAAAVDGETAIRGERLPVRDEGVRLIAATRRPDVGTPRYV